jgi:putative oxidoreductase
MSPVTAFPYLTLQQSLVLLRVAVALFFMAHAAVRVVVGGVPQFGAFLEARGFPFGVAIVWAISVYELAGGITFALGRWVRELAVGFMLIVVGGIVLIHAGRGWFVGEHGTGGVEYSLSLLVSLIVLAAAARPTRPA